MGDAADDRLSALNWHRVPFETGLTASWARGISILTRKSIPPSQKLWTALRELDSYLTGQSAWLVNYAERHRAGLRVGTSITEGTANSQTSEWTAIGDWARAATPPMRSSLFRPSLCQAMRGRQRATPPPPRSGREFRDI
jgi:hypothetical protein